MRSIFQSGILSAKQTQWGGEGQSGRRADAAVLPTLGQTSSGAAAGGTGGTSNDWGDDLSKIIQAAGTGYSSYTKEQIAEEERRAAEQKRAAAEAAARTAQIQQTTAQIQAGASGGGKIMGMDKGVFFLGASLLGILAIGATFYMIKAD